MDPIGTERFPLLNQTNWSTWKENMRFLLMDHGCWSFIDGSEPKLEETSTRRERSEYTQRQDQFRLNEPLASYACDDDSNDSNRPEKITISDDLDKSIPDTSSSNLKPCSSIPFYREAALRKNEGRYDVYYRVKGQKSPGTLEGPLKSPQSDKWQETMADEIQVMKDREAGEVATRS
ncbi:uncharacterized protein CDAR_309971 [Caerostris darwini]|uniref:DUF4219 domain-containing protein n=1 Tax=Caerostris darwini TaxID=1538125 RepID=A0AAV4W0E7_9ARAC|nr:uncharacterized protein CDAR_309971 [Caerostris darwini]